MNNQNPTPTPFDSAWDYIRRNDGSAAEALAKLMLSFWNYYDYPCSLPECIPPLDSERRDIAARMIAYYMQYGAEEAVSQYVTPILEKYPHLKG